MPRTVHSICPLDCPDACSLAVRVGDDGRIASLDGTGENPLTNGFICGKVRQIADHVYGDERLRVPLMRNGTKGSGAFRAATWDEALDTIVRRLLEIRDRCGGEAILPCHYGGSNGSLTDSCLDARFFRRLGASRIARTLCAAPTGAAAQGLYGRMAGVPLEDYEEAALVVMWGCNPGASGIHLVPPVREARRRNGRLVVIDPRRTLLARQADLHIAPRPGTDLVLALALIRWLFREGHADLEFLARHATGVDALREKAEPWTLSRAAREADIEEADLVRFATLYAATSPAVIRCGWGLERNRNGGSAAAAVLALPAVGGKFGVRGGGYTMSNSRLWNLDTEAAIGTPPAPTRTVNQAQLGQALLELDDPPIEALFVYNCNILATAPAQGKVLAGLQREGLFLVVYDQVLTDTARFADVILPATTFLEHEDLKAGYGGRVLGTVVPAIDPVGGARPNHAVFASLLERAGLSREGDAIELSDLRALLLRAHPERQQALDRGSRLLCAEGRGVQFGDVLPETPDGKIHLHPDALASTCLGGLYVYKPPRDPSPSLQLISPATAERISSTFGQLHRGVVPVELHPEDARERGLKANDRVRVFNAMGEMVVPLALNPALRRGVASHPKGLWGHNTLNGRTSNALCPDTEADLGGGACFNDARVEVVRMPD
jgi:anaerobic selenocysteine-containing dehydrogenase